jgi:hypothetical protein
VSRRRRRGSKGNAIAQLKKENEEPTVAKLKPAWMDARSLVREVRGWGLGAGSGGAAPSPFFVTADSKGVKWVVGGE